MRAALYYTLESKAYITNSLIVLQFFGYSNKKYFDISRTRIKHKQKALLQEKCVSTSPNYSLRKILPREMKIGSLISDNVHRSVNTISP